MSSIQVKNIVISGTNMWNPGDDFVRDGVIRVLRELFTGFQLNFFFYNFNQDFFPQSKFSGIANMASKGDLDQYRDSIDAIVIAGLSAGTEIKEFYNWIIQNRLHDRVYLIGAGYENAYVARYISEEPEATIFKNARIIIGRTGKTPIFISELNLPYHHLNCPAILSVPSVKHISPDKTISRIGFSLQLPHKQGISNQSCSQNMYDLGLQILLSLKIGYELDVIAHHKSEYFHFINILKEHNIPIIFSSFYHDLFDIYPRYDLLITTRLHSSLFANGFGIPGIIINDTDRHTHCLEGFPHSVWVDNLDAFNEEFNKIRYVNLQKIAEEADSFKENLLSKYLDILREPFGISSLAENKDSLKPNTSALLYSLGSVNFKQRVLEILSQLSADVYLNKNIETFRTAIRNGETWFDSVIFLNWYATIFKPATYLEVGVRRGRSISQVVLSSPKTMCFGFDMWISNYAGVDNPGSKFVLNEFHKLGAQHEPILTKGNSHETLPQFWADPSNPQQIDLIYIDGDHTYEGAKKDLDIAFSHLSPGGALLFDDISHPSHPELYPLWNEYKNQFPDYLFIEDQSGNGTACAFKPPFVRLEQFLQEPAKSFVSCLRLRTSHLLEKGIQETEKICGTTSVHFFTIVLNGEPFIRHHIGIFSKLPINWHWHIIEGVADLKHDTAWSVQFGGRITDELHNNGLSNDGTTEYLDELAKQYPENITIYRKPGGKFWDGKLEMVNAPLVNIRKECLLWQVDADEYWTIEHINAVYSMFADQPEKNAAYYLCNFFVGPELIVTTRDTYGNNTDYEWLRTWRYNPGDRWISHEPPRLCRRNKNGQWINLAKINPFMHNETEANNIIFNHYAYVAEQQLRFKEIYYGYAGAVKSWRSLQAVEFLPVYLKDYFPWVKDDALVDHPTLKASSSLGLKNILWIRPDSIGDNILASSMLQYIHNYFKGSNIMVLCQDHIAELYNACPYITKIITFNRKRAKTDENYRYDIIKLLRNLNVDLLLNSVYSRDPLTDFLALNSGAKETVALEGDLSNMPEELWHKNNTLYSTLIKSDDVYKSEMERSRDFLQGVNIYTKKLEPDIWIAPDDNDFAETFFKDNSLDAAKTICLFSGVQHNVRIFDGYGSALAEVCREYDFSVISIGNAADSEINQKNLDDVSVYTINISGKTNLLQTASILSRCRLAVGAETGLAHMACAVGVPNVILLGGGHFGRFMPYSSLTSIVCLPLDCYYCNWKCRYSRIHCVKGINLEVMAEAIKQTLEKKSKKPRIFVQGHSLWEQKPGYPRWQSFHNYLNVADVDIIPIGDINQDTSNLWDKLKSMDKTAQANFLGEASSEIIRHGENLFLNNDFEGAESSFYRALELQTNSPDALNNLGVLYHKLGKNKKALWYLEAAVKNQPDNLDYLKNLSHFYHVEMGRTREATELYLKVLEEQPSDIETLVALGQISIQSNVLMAAKTYFIKAYELDPENVEVQSFLESINKLEITGESSIHTAENKDGVSAFHTGLSSNINTGPVEDKQYSNQQFFEFPLINNDSIAVYFQPPSGNTEKNIIVKPLRIVGSTHSSYESLKDYEILDFGKGFSAAEAILRHILTNKLGRKFSPVGNFWLTVIGIDIECEITSATGGYFDEIRPETLEDISPEFAREESGERKAAIYSYKELMASGQDLGLALYASGAVLNTAGAAVDTKAIYMMDGARRIAAAALCHRRSITIRLLIIEDEYAQLLYKTPLKKIHEKIDALGWFDKYQSIPLLDIKGERTLKRFELMDMDILRNQAVMDFGCNIGQASLKAVQAGAREVIGIEGQKDTWITACTLGKFSRFQNIRYLNVDFNDIHFDRIINSEYPDKADYSFFFSLYRTKELKQRDHLFKYIINKTKKGIFFEGHAHPKIDTIEYYDWLFQCFGLTYKYLGTSEGNLRPLFFIPLSSIKSKDIGDRDDILKTSEIKYSEALDHPPLVSAIVSTYKSEKFIEGKLKDLLQQTLKNRIEIIVVDSGSPENERAIVEKYMQKHANIKYIRTDKRETVYQAWNRGIKTARGRYITNANTDDRLRPDALEILVRELEQNPSVTVVYGDFFITNIENSPFTGHIRCGYSIKPDYDPSIMLSGCQMGPQPMWRKSVHDELGYFDDSLESAGDYEFWCRIATKYPMKHINEFLGLYYHNPNGIVNRSVAKSNRETSIVKEKYALLLPHPVRDTPTGFYYRQAIDKNHYVNICMITYNRLQFSKQAIEALVRFTNYPYVLTVIDNNSHDGTKEYLSELHKAGIIKNLILLNENVGVAKASNLAWHLELEAEYYLKLDNDIVIQKPDWLTNMIRVINAIPEAGAVGYNFEPISFPLSIINNMPIRIKDGTLGGACILIPKRTEKLIGYWCEDYGLYSEEDADYGNRILLTGLNNIYMEDENIGIHLPAGKAAIIDPVTFIAKDGVEEKEDEEYRIWKDEQRRKNILGDGIFLKNLNAYRNGQQPLYRNSMFVQAYGKEKEKMSIVASTRKLKIGFLSAEPHSYACPYLRLHAPLTILQRNNFIKFLSLSQITENKLNLDLESLAKCDIIIVQRQFAALMPYEELIKHIDRSKQNIVYELDDAFTKIQPSHISYNYIIKISPFIENYITKADLVTVSTESLKSYYNHMNKNIVVIQNSLDLQIWRNIRHNESLKSPVCILFSGTLTHADDLGMIENVIEKVLIEFGDKVRFFFWGNVLERLRRFSQVKVLSEFTPDYAAYAKTLIKTHIDLAIIPLEDNAFNRAKSHIKWLEYSACKIPGIYSNIGEYRTSIKNNETGVLVDNNTDQWYKELRDLILDKTKRERIANAAYEEVLAKYTLEKNFHLWMNAYNSILGEENIRNITASSISKPRVSIIIPLFNKLDYTKRCLEALIENTPDELYEVVIVDNGSTDGTKDFLAILEGDVTIIRNETNLGFAHACNQGADAAKGTFLLFLNNDTEPQKGWLKPLLKILDNDPTVAAAGSKLLFPDGTIQHAGVVIINDRKLPDPLVAHHIFYHQRSDLIEANQLRTYQALTAACMLIRKYSYEKISGFDEGYWNGYEDVDLCFKLQEKGWKLVYQPESVVIHYESISGPERFSKVDNNINRLHERWIGKINPDLIINEDGSITNTDANRIQQYAISIDMESRIESVMSEAHTSFVSIIILTFNQLKYTQKCLQSIAKYTSVPYELILVDNGSTDGTAPFLEDYANKHDNCKIILNNENRGFAGGNNQGIAAAEGDYILLLNNDVIVTQDWLELLIAHMESDENIGMAGPVSNSVSGPQQVKHVTYGQNMNKLQNFARNYSKNNVGRTQEILRLVGFCLLIKRKVLDIIGGLDENYGNGNYEDDDLCLRSRIAGFQNILAHDVYIHHYGSMTFKGNKMDYTDSLEGNCRLFADKWKDIIEVNGNEYRTRMTKEDQLKKLLEWGEERFSQGNFKAAVKIFERVLKLDKANSQAMNNLGVIQWQIGGEPAPAMKTFQAALTLNPKDSNALENLVQAAMKSSRFDLINPALLKTVEKAQPANPDLVALINAQQNLAMTA